MTVASLKKTLKETLDEKQALEEQSDLTAKRLIIAEKLTGQLAEEQVSWTERVGVLDIGIHKLVGDVFISSASVSYYGPFTGVFRADPQEQGKKWIKKMEAKNKITTSRITDKNMLRDLENCIRIGKPCIRIGKPLLIEDIGELLDPALETVLQKATFKQGGRLLIRLGDSDVDYDPAFKFYLMTKLLNPHYLPEVCIKVTIINFTVTTVGLEDQLLGDGCSPGETGRPRKFEQVGGWNVSGRQAETSSFKIRGMERERRNDIMERIFQEKKESMSRRNEESVLVSGGAGGSGGVAVQDDRSACRSVGRTTNELDEMKKVFALGG